MKNSIGTGVILTLFGESHGPAVGVVLDGLAPGLPVDESAIEEALSRRRPAGPADTARVEPDSFRILSGVYRGRTTGTPLTIVIPNENVRSADYSQLERVARPSHADYTAQMKYHGFQDPRGGGHFSGRVTAGIVAAGAICRQALSSKGILLGTHILRCGGVEDAPFTDVASEVARIEARRFPLILDLEDQVEAAVLAAKREQDSLGGMIQTGICGLPAGLGEPWFDSLEGVLARAVFAVGGIKGIEFGDGFGLAALRGSQANDPFRMQDGRVVTATNRSGGINGGITNGMPVLFNMAVKPTPSISRKQQTVDFVEGKETELGLTGRHDPAIIRRICPVVTALVAVVLCDQLSLRFGTDFLATKL
ncbi:MAG: chorismate synthase [Bacteroidales bacterium]|nr:chorismate synthase [Bacteroidales bacterium]